VRQFFPSIDHALLRQALARKIHDSRVLWLCDRIINSGIGILSDEFEMAWFHGDDLMAANRPRGLPIGNLTSQFWANVYLNSFDHFVMRRLRPGGYLRYVDDVLLFGRSKTELWNDLAAAAYIEIIIASPKVCRNFLVLTMAAKLSIGILSRKTAL
jgi:hypothetical protein